MSRYIVEAVTVVRLVNENGDVVDEKSRMTNVAIDLGDQSVLGIVEKSLVGLNEDMVDFAEKMVKREVYLRRS